MLRSLRLAPNLGMRNDNVLICPCLASVACLVLSWSRLALCVKGKYWLVGKAEHNARTEMVREQILYMFDHVVNHFPIGKWLFADTVVRIQFQAVDLWWSAEDFVHLEPSYIGNLFELLQRFSESRKVHDLRGVRYGTQGSYRAHTR